MNKVYLQVLFFLKKIFQIHFKKKNEKSHKKRVFLLDFFTSYMLWYNLN